MAGKYAHTPQGVFELRYFFSEAVQGSAGSTTPLLLVKRRVKKMIDDGVDGGLLIRAQLEGCREMCGGGHMCGCWFASIRCALIVACLESGAVLVPS